MNISTKIEWETKTLDEIVSIESGGRPKGSVDDYDGDIPSIGGGELNNEGEIEISEDSPMIPREFYENMNKGVINEKDILIVKDGATTGKTAFVDDGSYLPAAVNSHVYICRILDSSEFMPKFVFYFLKSKWGQSKIEQNKKGAAQQGINMSFAKDIEVPVPPLGEQGRIVREIEERLDTITTLEHSINNIQQLSNEYEDSLLAFLFAGRNLNTEEMLSSELKESQLPAKWDIKELSECMEEISTGATPRRSDDVNWGGEIKWAKAGEISSAGKYIYDTEERVTETASPNTYGDEYIFVTIIGANLGSTALPTDEMAINQQNVSIKPNQDVSREYLYYYIQSIENHLTELGRGGGQKAINQTILKQVKIPVPPMDEQLEIIQKMEEIDFTKLENSINIIDNLTNEYEKSILSEAFSGNI